MMEGPMKTGENTTTATIFSTMNTAIWTRNSVVWEIRLSTVMASQSHTAVDTKVTYTLECLPCNEQ